MGGAAVQTRDAAASHAAASTSDGTVLGTAAPVRAVTSQASPGLRLGCVGGVVKAMKYEMPVYPRQGF